MNRGYVAILFLFLIICSACTNTMPPTATLPPGTPGGTSRTPPPPALPTVQADDVLSNQILQQEITAQLVTKVVQPGFGGQVFCAYEAMETVQSGPNLTSYLAIFCQEYYRQDEQLLAGSGANDFAVLTVDMSGATPRVGGLATPSLSNYNDEMRSMFPTHLHTRINGRELTPALNARVLAEAEQHFSAQPTP